jgi:hypothetical protein
MNNNKEHPHHAKEEDVLFKELRGGAGQWRGVGSTHGEALLLRVVNTLLSRWSGPKYFAIPLFLEPKILRPSKRAEP